MRPLQDCQMSLSDDEWVLWSASAPLSSLQQRGATSIDDYACKSASVQLEAAVVNKPQRNRYNEVVHRFDKALKQAASFSHWENN